MIRTCAGRLPVASLLALLGLGLGVAERAAGDDELEQRFAVEPDVRVEIEILSGKVELRGIDESEVRIRAKGGVEIDGSRRRVRVRAPATRGFPWTKGVDAELEIAVPREARVRARTVNAPIQAEGLEGELELHAANGKIEVKGKPREAELETMNASIQFEGENSEVEAKTLNGSIELSGVTGDVEASTVSGSIRVEGRAIERAELRTISGEIELEASLARRARVHAKSYSGKIHLRLPEDTSARFDIESFSGGVDSEFLARVSDEESGLGGWRRGAGRRLSFVVGEGDARVSIESFSGGVEIEADGDSGEDD